MNRFSTDVGKRLRYCSPQGAEAVQAQHFNQEELQVKLQEMSNKELLRVSSSIENRTGISLLAAEVTRRWPDSAESLHANAETVSDLKEIAMVLASKKYIRGSEKGHLYNAIIDK